MDFNKKAFGKYIKKKREEKGISREQLAKELNVSYEALTKWENGNRIPDFPTIGIIAAKLEVSIQDIYDHSTIYSENTSSVATTIGFILLFGALLSGVIIGLVRINKHGNTIPMDSNYEEKIIRVYHGFPTNSGDSNQEEYINQYLENAGCDFRIELVGNDTGLAYEEYLANEKAAGETIDIEYAYIGDHESRQVFIKRAESDEYYAIDKLLETENGRKLIAGLNQYMTAEDDDEKTIDYIEQYRLKDDHIYGVPMYANFSAPYFLCCSESILDKYGVEELSGDITDIDKILAKADEMLRDNIIPVSICCGFDCDKLFGALYGFEAYDEFWLLKQNQNNCVEAINIFENEELSSWYQKLGELRQDGVIGLPNDYSKFTEDKNALIDMDKLGERSAGMLFFGTEDWIGQITGAGIVYDVLNVETSLPLRDVLCINNRSLYPEECFQFIEMLYYDIDFRRLVNLGPEGVGYELREEDGRNIIHQFSNVKGIPFALGLGRDYLIYQTYDNEDFHMYQEKIYEGNSYAHRSMMGLADEIDYSEVMAEYEACNRIFRHYEQVFYGAYGDDTKEELDKMYEMLVDAGYLKVLEEMNRQLGGGK